MPIPTLTDRPEPTTRGLVPEELYLRHVDDVTRWVGHLIGPSSAVEDLVQEVFLVVLRRAVEFRGEAKPTTWLYRIVLNVVRNHRRGQRFRRWLSLSTEQTESLPDLGRNAEEALLDEAQRMLVYRVLERLPERQRQVLILFEMEELSGAEIAERLGIKLTSVWVMLSRARISFASGLEKQKRKEGPCLV